MSLNTFLSREAAEQNKKDMERMTGGRWTVEPLLPVGFRVVPAPKAIPPVAFAVPMFEGDPGQVGIACRNCFADFQAEVKNGEVEGEGMLEGIRPIFNLAKQTTRPGCDFCGRTWAELGGKVMTPGGLVNESELEFEDAPETEGR